MSKASSSSSLAAAAAAADGTLVDLRLSGGGGCGFLTFAYIDD